MKLARVWEWRRGGGYGVGGSFMTPSLAGLNKGLRARLAGRGPSGHQYLYVFVYHCYEHYHTNSRSPVLTITIHRWMVDTLNTNCLTKLNSMYF